MDPKIIETQLRVKAEIDEHRQRLEKERRAQEIMEERKRAVKQKKRKEKEERRRLKAEEEQRLKDEEEEKRQREEKMAAMRKLKSASKSVTGLFRGGKSDGEEESPPASPRRRAVRRATSDGLTTHYSPRQPVRRSISANTENISEEIRSVRAFSLWGKWAQPPKRRYKEKIAENPDCPISEDDVDLLVRLNYECSHYVSKRYSTNIFLSQPWNYNNTLVNAAKMLPIIQKVNSQGISIDTSFVGH